MRVGEAKNLPLRILLSMLRLRSVCKKYSKLQDIILYFFDFGFFTVFFGVVLSESATFCSALTLFFSDKGLTDFLPFLTSFVSSLPAAERVFLASSASFSSFNKSA